MVHYPKKSESREVRIVPYVATRQRRDVVGFLVKEKTPYINAIANNAKVAICPGTIIAMNNVIVTILLLRLGNKTIYAGHLDYYAQRGRKNFANLAMQNMLYLVFYNEHCKRVRSISTPNQIKNFFHFTHELITKVPAWSSVDFLHESKLLSYKYQASDLWQRFSNGSKWAATKS